jgi:exodeoxyribonuclease VII large subunit
VQGSQAPGELAAALGAMYRLAEQGTVDVILLVRGGGSLEDLWAFNDEQLARTIVASPVPLVSGVGHETDFTIADFCADVRAPTPTAAAELAAQPQETWLAALHLMHERLREAAWRRIDRASQRLDRGVAHLGRPSARTAQQHLRIERPAQRLRFAVAARVRTGGDTLTNAQTALGSALAQRLERAARQCDRLGLRLQLLDPRLVLQRGYALITDAATGHPITSAGQLHAQQDVRAALADGEVDLRVMPGRAIRP